VRGPLAAVLLFFVALAPASAAPLDTHPVGGPWLQQIESARHQVALAALVRDLELTDEQAKRLHAILQKLDHVVRSLVKGSDGPVKGWTKALAGLRDRALALPTGVPSPTRADLAAHRAFNENLDQLEREVGPARDELAGLLTPKQQKVLRAFVPDRALAGLTLDDEELEEWNQRVVALRDAPAADLETRVKEQLADQLEEAGHPKRLPDAMKLVAEMRGLTAERFDGRVTEYAKKLRKMMGAAPTTQAEPPPEATDLPGAVDNHLLDMRMLPVIEAELAQRKR
jgi:hypothetical protein